MKKTPTTKKNSEPKVVVNWRPAAGEPSPAWRRLADKLLANRKKKPAGTGEATGECNDEQKRDTQNSDF